MLTLPMPTMAVISGHCYAAGVFFALGHDMRVMASKKAKFCLSEANIGFAIPHPGVALCDVTLPPGAIRTLHLGISVSSQEAKEMAIVNNLYEDTADIEQQIAQFAETYAPKGAYKSAMKVLKNRIYEEFVDKSQRVAHGPEDVFHLT